MGKCDTKKFGIKNKLFFNCFCYEIEIMVVIICKLEVLEHSFSKLCYLIFKLYYIFLNKLCSCTFVGIKTDMIFFLNVRRFSKSTNFILFQLINYDRVITNQTYGELAKNFKQESF